MSMSKQRARCAAIRVGWGRCEREAGHRGDHRAGDEDAGGYFTTKEGKQSEHEAKLKSGELYARVVRRAKELLDEYASREPDTPMANLYREMTKLREAVEEVERG